MAKIMVSKGRTYNIGNYESLRLDVSVEDDRDFESIRRDVNEYLSQLEQEHRVGGK